MSKKLTNFILTASILACSTPVFATNSETDWKTLYTAKIEEITTGYENGTKDRSGVPDYGFSYPYFSVQDINFDGVPELYHAIISMFELEPSVQGNEEIYYIKDGAVVQGKIEPGSDFCLTPMYSGRKAAPGALTTSRWQFAMRNTKNNEVCFITNDSYSGFIDYPPITYSKLTFDITTGTLKSEVLLHMDMETYIEPVYLQGYDYVGADCYTSLSSDYGWGISDWKPCYLAPNVVVNDKQILFDVQPQIMNDRTMVPLRAIFEALGAEVSWDSVTSTVTAIKNDITIKMTIGADSFSKNNENISLDSPAIIIDSRTLVPVRAIAESFGSVVDWDSLTRTVTITSNATEVSIADTKEVK